MQESFVVLLMHETVFIRRQWDEDANYGPGNFKGIELEAGVAGLEASVRAKVCTAHQ